MLRARYSRLECRRHGRTLLLVAFALLTAEPGSAVTLLGGVRFAPDIVVAIGPGVGAGQLAEDDLAGSVACLGLPALPDGVQVDGYERLAGGAALLSFDVDVALPGGVVARPADVVRLSGGSYTLVFDALAAGLPPGANVDAVATIDGGDLLLSFDTCVNLGGVTADPRDVLRVGAVAVTRYLAGAATGIPDGADVDAVDRLPNGHLLLSLNGSVRLAGLDADDEDVLEYDLASLTWAMAYDGSIEHPGWGGGPNLVVIASIPAITVCGIDADGDGVGDACDNCPNIANVDQANADCGDPAFLAVGGCLAPPAERFGCCDGGDLCDACPTRADDTLCAGLATLVTTIDATGGTASTPDNGLTLTAPPGAVSAPTSVSVSTNGPASSFALTGATVRSVSARPAGLQFALPVTITMRWDDRDGDGLIDRGQCLGLPAAVDLGLPCDANVDCSSGVCSVSQGVTDELALVLKRDAQRFSASGFGAQPFRCVDHLSGACAVATADCVDPPGMGRATVARCCDPIANEWTFETCSFSEFFLGLNAGDLIPGKGATNSDCQAQWSVSNPLNVPFLDRKGLPNFKQTCVDGDASCDADGMADGVCMFSVAVCFGTDDRRLGDGVCMPAASDLWILKRPKVNSTRPYEAFNAVALRNAVAANGGTVGADPSQVLFAPPLAADSCSDAVLLAVPLRRATRAGKTTLTMQTFAGATKDRDKLQLICRPAGS